MEKNENLTILLTKLQNHLMPNFQEKSQIENKLSYFMRLLNSRLTMMKMDESQIIFEMTDILSKTTRIEEVNKFQILYSNLKSKKSLKRRREILLFLYKLIPNNANNNIEVSKVLQTIFQKQEPDEKLYIDRMELDQKIEKALNTKQTTQNKRSPLIVNKPNNSYSKTIYEQDLVKDLIFVFQGIDGHYITYTSNLNNSAFYLNPKIQFNDNVVDIVSHLCELGFLYKKVREQLNYFNEANIPSQIIQSFCFSIQNELNDYYKLISIFKKMCKNDEISSNSLGENNFENELTLKKLYLWTLEPTERMKWLAVSCDAVANLRGIPIISQIYSYVYYCGAQKYLGKVLQDIAKPMFKIIKNWIILGQLQDVHKEFFVEIKENVHEDDIWRQRYNIVVKNVPSFFNKNTVQKIFEIGKCVNFIRTFCGEKDFTLLKIKGKIVKIDDNYETVNLNMKEIVHNNIIEEDQTLDIKKKQGFSRNNLIISEESHKININQEQDKRRKYLKSLEFIFNLEQDEISFDILPDLYSEIDIVHKEINKELISILFNKFLFKSHLESLYRYLLLGQGDMMQYLMNLMVPELNKPSSQVYIAKHNLSSILETAIKASNAQYHSSECINRLNIKLLEPNLGDTGWDIFSLEYIIKIPLTVIFNKNLLLRYQELFKFFWKLKKLEYNQSQIWRNFFYHSHNLKKKFDQNRRQLHKTMLVNQQIIHFCSNLHNYIALEVLETEWKNILEKLETIEFLDDLINLHDNFVKNILERSLINYPDIHKKLEKIFDLIMRFNTTQEILFTTVLEEIYRQDNYNYMNESRSKKSKKEDPLRTNVFMQINIFYENYIEEIIDLIMKIDLVGKGNLKFLAMKLDYNNFYSEINDKKINQNHFGGGASKHVREHEDEDENNEENNLNNEESHYNNNYIDEEDREGKSIEKSSYRNENELENNDLENEEGDENLLESINFTQKNNPLLKKEDNYSEQDYEEEPKDYENEKDDSIHNSSNFKK